MAKIITVILAYVLILPCNAYSLDTSVTLRVPSLFQTDEDSQSGSYSTQFIVNLSTIEMEPEEAEEWFRRFVHTMIHMCAREGVDINFNFNNENSVPVLVDKNTGKKIPFDMDTQAISEEIRLRSLIAIKSLSAPFHIYDFEQNINIAWGYTDALPSMLSEIKVDADTQQNMGLLKDKLLQLIKDIDELKKISIADISQIAEVHEILTGVLRDIKKIRVEFQKIEQKIESAIPDKEADGAICIIESIACIKESIDDTRDIARDRIRFIGSNISRESIDINKLIKTMIDNLHVSARALDFQCPDKLPEVMANPLMIKQVLSNLLMLKEDMRATSIKANISEDEGNIVIEVINKGHDMSKEGYEILNAFQWQEVVELGFQGDYFSLLEARVYIEDNGGTIKAEPLEEGIGTKFTIILPISENANIVTVPRIAI